MPRRTHLSRLFHRFARAALAPALVLLALGALWPAIARADGAPDQTIQIVDQQPAVVIVAPQSGVTTTVTTTVTLRDASAMTTPVHLSALLRDDRGLASTLPATPRDGAGRPLAALDVAPYTVTLVTLTLSVPASSSSSALTGYLIVASPRAVTQRPLTITYAVAVPPWMNDSALLSIAGLAAAVVVLAAWRPRLGSLAAPVLGPVQWNVPSIGASASGSSAGDPGATSWISTLGVAGAIVNLVGTQKVLPDTLRYRTPAQYGGLAVLFAAMTLIAPLAYALTTQPAETMGQDERQGRAYVFFVACGLTLWGVYGQLLLLLLFLLEMAAANVLTLPPIVVFAALLAATALLVGVYSWSKIGALVHSPQQPANGASLHPRAAGLAPAGQAPAAPQGQPRPWTLL